MCGSSYDRDSCHWIKSRRVPLLAKHWALALHCSATAWVNYERPAQKLHIDYQQYEARVGNQEPTGELAPAPLHYCALLVRQHERYSCVTACAAHHLVAGHLRVLLLDIFACDCMNPASTMSTKSGPHEVHSWFSRSRGGPPLESDRDAFCGMPDGGVIVNAGDCVMFRSDVKTQATK